MDTLIQFIDIEPEIRFYLPNAFTPNYDNVNDIYHWVGLAGRGDKLSDVYLESLGPTHF